MVIYKSGDVLSRHDCSLKTASRIGNIIRKILFQNTNGNKFVRDVRAKAEQEVKQLFATVTGAFAPVAYARA